MPESKKGLGVIGGLVGLAGLTALPSIPAAMAEEGGIEEVIVTARRKEENLQTVPISVTALSGEALAARGITDIVSLGAHVPALKISQAEVNPKKFSATIRGLRTNSSLVPDDPAVATYFAEGGLFHPYGVSQMFFDIQSVQVLKGPQGTLFGKNTTGGAVLIEPNKPNFDGFDGYAKVGVGNYDMRKFEGVINAPLNDVAAIRIGYAQNERDGFTKVLRTGQDLDSVNDRAVRFQLTVKPTANITSNTIVDMLEDRGSPTTQVLLGIIPSNVPAAVGFTLPGAQKAVAAQAARGPWVIDTMFGSGVAIPGTFPASLTASGDAFNPMNCPTGNGAGKPYCRDNSLPKQLVDVKGFLNNTSIDLGGVTVKNIVSYRQTDYKTDLNEAVPSSIDFFGIQSMFVNKIHQASDELQFSGKALDDKMDWIGGLFVSKEVGHDRSTAYQFTYFNPAGNGKGWTASESHSRNVSKAIFAQADYKLNDQWKLTVGARETWDYRWARNESLSSGGTRCATLDPATGFSTAQTTTVPNCYFLSNSKNWASPTGTVSLAYQASADTMWYGTLRRGYKSGGFSSRAVAPSAFTYNPETVQDIELGVKSDARLGDMPIRTNAAVFNSDVKNQQLQIVDTTTIPGQILTGTANAGKARIYGGELELTLLPTPSLELGAFLSYVNAKYLEYLTQNPATKATVDVHDISWGANGGNVGLAHWQGGLTARYTVPLQDKGTVVLFGDVTMRQHTDVNNDIIRTKYPFLTPQLPEPGYGVVNLRADWKHFWGNPVDLSFYVNNAGDKTYIAGGAVVAGFSSATFGARRTFGLELNYKFGEGFKPKE